MFRLRKNSGFTLAELMVVIGIIAIISALAIPRLIGWLPNHKLGNCAMDILSTLEGARMRAVRDRVSVGIEFTDTVNYRIWIDNGAGAGNPDDATYHNDETLIMDRALPAGIEVDLGGGPSNFRFNSQGFPLDENDIPLSGKLKLTNGELDRYIHLTIAGGVKISKDENP